jgi:biopolymer transport protein ExbD
MSISGQSRSARLRGDRERRTAALLRRDPQTPVLVKADTTVPYGTVVRAMVLLQHAGAAKVGFLTDPVRPVPRIKPPSARVGSTAWSR